MSHKVIDEWFLLGRYRVLKLDGAAKRGCAGYRINGRLYLAKPLREAELENYIAIRTEESFLGAAVEFI